MVDPINATITATESGFLFPLLNVVGTYTAPLVKKISIALGGIFGLYLIILLVRWWQNRILIGVLKDIRADLDRLNEKLKVKPRKKERLSKVRKKLRKIFEK